MKNFYTGLKFYHLPADYNEFPLVVASELARLSDHRAHFQIFLSRVPT